LREESIKEKKRKKKKKKKKRRQEKRTNYQKRNKTGVPMNSSKSVLEGNPMGVGSMAHGGRHQG